ncbi:MAG: hypothetical protein P8J20_15525 [Novosphingobium sp.]|nr:hypothetical protein [Novosphingobium sp.]
MTAPAVDVDKMVSFMDAKIAAETNSRYRANLQTVRAHMYHETMLDPDGVLATLSPDASYKMWVDGVDSGPKDIDAIRRWYVDENIRKQKSFVIEYDLERVVVADDMVVTEGEMKVVVDGVYARDYFGRECLPDDMFLQSFRQVVFWPMDENANILGEDFYISGSARDGAWRKLAPEEVPEQWHTLVAVAQAL